ncbi:hypothetical protein LO772_15140 [Yinghuangia sp. ASG 101]|uniref:DUF6879 family protein n=1 Tax=Yinghuangia sp. ASG 101 TaxID=2896848 RepID=UPI001E510A86|nr:DUF6879 family protein [Yinghuangia sp. ASG 101]UGQ14785.1 hypothetical protein LO772_15140 [Yinghuangia sp. ASG 101]
MTSRINMAPGQPDYPALLHACRSSAMHVEMRDAYAVSHEDEDWAAWLAGERDPARNEDRWSPFCAAMSQVTARGVAARRLRVVSTPVTEYVKFEHAGTPANVRAGEQVRWLPRMDARDLLLPPLDFWIFDETRLLLHHFDGDGAWLGHEFSDDPQLIEVYLGAFARLWERGVPHREFAV